MKRVAVLALLATLLVSNGVAADTLVEIYSRPGCPHCAEARHFLDELKSERADFSVLEHDVTSDPDALERLAALSAGAGIQTPGVPTFIIGDSVLVGFDPNATPARIRALLGAGGAPAREGAQAHPQAVQPLTSVELPLVGRVEVERLGLPLFTVLVGLLDGFNPCAMWVLLFLLAMLVNLKSRSRMALIAGTFVVVSGVVYFAFMAAWLTVFMLIGISQPVRILLAVVAVLVGSINIKDFFTFRRGPSLSIPESAKPGIYRRIREILHAENLAGAVVGIAVLAFLVNLVELLCTAGLPALYTAILTSHQLPPWKYYAYLTLYIGAYVVDDAIMVTIGVVTLGRRKLQERGGRWLKLLSGLVILALGLLLLVRPRLLGF
jgi:glutaredoxin